VEVTIDMMIPRLRSINTWVWSYKAMKTLMRTLASRY